MEKAQITATERSRNFRRRKKEAGDQKALLEEKRVTKERVRAIRARVGKSAVQCTRKCKDPECKLHEERDRTTL